MGLLTGRHALITGIANKRSIAWGIAQAMAREGAEIAITYQNERFGRNLAKLTAELPRPPLQIQLDVGDDAQLAALGPQLGANWPKLDILVHCLAFARSEDLSGRFIDATREGWAVAQNISAYSLVALTRATLSLLHQSDDPSVQTVTYLGSTRVLPNYHVIGAAKASLEASVRYLAHDLGGDGVRVNAISPGPVRTLAAAGVRGFHSSMDVYAQKAPLKRQIDTQDIGNAAVFLGSAWARNITGQVLFVDAGFHVMGA